MQGFPFGRSMREHFLKLLGSVMNDIEHNFIDTMFAVKSLSSGIDQDWLCSRVPARSPARDCSAFFTKKVQPAVDAIDAYIEALKKKMADLEACRECLLSCVASPSHFGDLTFISGLW